MASYSVTTTKYISELTGKTGIDTYNVDAGTLIIDCDSRYAPNSTPTTGPLGNLTVSSTVGGLFSVTTEFTKLIQFDTGTGIVPAYGTVITKGTASATILCVMELKTGGATYAAGATMPATGWLKVRVATNGFTSGTVTGAGYALNLTDGVLSQGWINIVGVQDRSHSHSRLGSMSMRGDWVSVGSTSGVRGQNIQLPHFTADGRTDYPGVDIETSPGSGTYQFWPNAGLYFTSVECSTDSRSSFVYISTVGVVTIGTGTNAQPTGHLPVAGCDVRIPSIILQECAATNLQTTVEPWRNIGTRYESSFTNAGLCTLSKVTGTWYWNIVQAYSLYMRDVHVCDNILIGEIGTKADIDNLHIGLSTATTEYASNAFVFQQCYYGGVVGTMSFLRGRSTATSGYAAIVVNCYGGWTFAKLRGGHTGAPTAVSGAIYFNTNGVIVIDEAWTFAKRVLVQAGTSFKLKKLIYADKCIGTTDTTAQSRAVEAVAMATNMEITDIQNWPGVANCHPYLALFYANTTSNSSLRSCGTAAVPFNAGTVNTMGYIFDDGGNNSGIMIQRNWITALRLGLHGGTNTTNTFTSVNNYQVDASKTIGPQQQSSVVHGNRFNSGGVPNSFSAVYGTCMWDGFTGDTTTRAALILVEKTPSTPDVYTITGGFPKFNGAGKLVMLTTGDQVAWAWPWMILGWNGLASFARQGVNVTNFTYEYDLDKGNGFSGVWKTFSTANLLAEVIDPVVGFRPKVRITCIIGSATNRIDSFSFDGTTTLALQNAALYPLPSTGFKITGFPNGSDIVIYDDSIPSNGAGANVVATGNNVSTEWSYTYSGYPLITIGIFCPGYVPAFFRGIQMTGIDSTYKVQLFVDRNYIS